MATHIEYQHRPPTPQELLAEAGNDPQSAEALLEGLKLLRALHDHGVLDVANKLVRGGSGLAGGALEIMEGQSSVHLLRNLLEGARTLSELDPNTTGTLGRAVVRGVNEGARRVARSEGVGLGELMGLMRDKDVQIALGALFGTLKGFGRALREGQEELAELNEASQKGGKTTSSPTSAPADQGAPDSKSARSTSRYEAGR